ncbi:MAG: ATP-binding protein [Deltaproteobacteria bacterium]|nr:ATP-binding protein [Deltaproteobacteria bacterium]
MTRRYRPRAIEGLVKKAAREFPAVVLTGPRQSGKTTLLRHLFAQSHEYVSLEPPDVRASASVDPRGFLEMHPAPVIFDEVQYAPGLLPYIKERIDAKRDRRGQYLLTGSQNLLLMERVTESLAGRAAILRLLPFSRKEAVGFSDAPPPWETRRPATERPAVSSRTLWNGFLRGGYPELVTDPKRDAALWHAGYVQTYLERDVRGLRQVGDLGLFQNFLRSLAARSGSLLNIADIARDIGVAVNTAKAWLSVLETSSQVFVVRPWFANINKRLVKTPKVYFADVGTLCWLVGLRDIRHAAEGPMGGAIFETAVFLEIMKSLVHRGMDGRIHFWRTSAGAEVDFLVESAGRLVPIEVKLSSTPRPEMAAGIRSFHSDLKDRAAPGFVVYPGSVRLPLAPDITAVPFVEL